LRSLVAAARLSAEAGEPLLPGWLVMAGGATAAEPLKPGQHIALEMQGLGRVEVTTIDSASVRHADQFGRLTK
jgi:2-oxo-3-hexenedioate decarboxylase